MILRLERSPSLPRVTKQVLGKAYFIRLEERPATLCKLYTKVMGASVGCQRSLGIVLQSTKATQWI
jgi:hypothetical protein